MYLKSLEMQGFKSFPDKIKLGFDKGLTAVVGPNGSGKSNIADAVRWVLGEQSTKTLRGSKMEDVIFSGTMQRKAVGFASVTLTIDNSNRRFGDIENDEVAVTRKIYRSGESEYMINGKGVRLKDINELFMDTGLGRDGYSIIGQGRIAEIVGAKSEQRRDIFEEAAGISKFRYRKEEAQHKLKGADENLIRINDIVAELEGRVEPLRIQSEKAKQFIALSNERKSLEISVSMQKLSGHKSDLDKLSEKLLICIAQCDGMDSEIAKRENSIKDDFRHMQEMSAEIEKLRGGISENEHKKAQLSSDIAVFRNDISHAETIINSLTIKKQTEMNAAENYSENMTQRKKALAELEKAYTDTKEEILSLEKSLENAVMESKTLGEEYTKAQTSLNGLYIAVSEANAKITSAKSAMNDISEQKKRDFFHSDEIKRLISRYKTDEENLTDDIESLELLISEQENRINGFSKLYKTKMEKLDELIQKNEKIQFTVREHQQRIKLLNELESSMEGFQSSVKEVMRAAKTSAYKGVKGTVAQLIHVESEYVLAIETALGGALQNIVVDDENTAKSCIRLLKEKRAGRATFLPMTSVKGQEFHIDGISSENGFIAMASELADTDSEYCGIINQILGRIVVAEDIDCASAIAKKYGYKFRIVTLDGQVINAGGSFTGGSAVRSAGVLTRKNEIEKLEYELSETELEAKSYTAQITRLKNETGAMADKIEEERTSLSDITSDKAKFSAEYERIHSLRKQYENQLSSSDERIKYLEDRKKQQSDIVNTAEKELLDMQNRIKELEQKLSSEFTKRENLVKEREEASQKLSCMRIRETELSKDMQAAEREIEIIKGSANELSTRISGLDAEKAENEKSIEEKNELIKQYQALITQTEARLSADLQKITELNESHDKLEGGINSIRDEIKEFENDKQGIYQEKARLDERKNAVQRDYDSIISMLYETYELTRSDAEKIAKPVQNMAFAQSMLSELKMQIKQLGNVNVAAIDEYAEVSERFEFMTTQLKDVTKSKRELEKLIDDLTSDMKTLFTDSFNRINEKFKHIFTKLFGGGHAELRLTDEMDVLTSGIEINAAPPGKVIKNLISLSGGEQSFIAIAIYFAILEIRPAPFCILDEIDAALDESNVIRYAQYLKNFTDTTQFIIVTHRRGTMEAANVLYGVTMQDNGVSKLLKLQQPDETIESA